MASLSLSQQRALAYAQKPSAIVSFLSSCYVAYHLLFQRPEKRNRLYHRLILAMNVAVMLLSLMYFCGSWVVPAGTPGYVGAVGSVQSCTAQGFIILVTTQTIPFYYCSLALQSFLAMRNNFRERNYAWIEKWLHCVAWIVPCALTAVVAATDNINPGGANCWMAKAPRGCESDPEVPCERGKDIGWFVNVFALGQLLLYFVLPPMGAWAIFRHIRKVQRRFNVRSYRNCSSRSAQVARASAQKKVLYNVAVQISVYLISFWLTSLLGIVGSAHELVTGIMLFGLRVASNVIYSSQGFVLTVVYFSLEKIAGGDTDAGPGPVQRGRTSARTPRPPAVLSVPNNAERSVSSERKPPEEVEPLTFHIFEGIHREHSAWAVYFDETSNEGSSEDDEVDAEDGLVKHNTWHNDDLAGHE